jgi:1A family penicillin-binding protein
MAQPLLAFGTVPLAQPTLSDRLRRKLAHLQARSRAWATTHPKTLASLAALTLAVAVATCWFTYDVFSGLPGTEQLRALGDETELTTIYDAHDQPIFTIPTQYHTEVPLARVSQNLRKAIVAVEDVRFYEHGGIDGIRVVAAILQDIRERRKAEGASTITQQLARASFLNRGKTLRRKVKEAILAQRLEKLYSKDEILEFYLNKVYFGDGLYGVEAAARGYFGKPASDLTLAEAALIAGLVKAPSSTNPTVSMDKSVSRRNVVLKLMLDNNFIDQAAYRQAVSEPVVLQDTLRREDPVGVHFKEQVRRELVERFGKKAVFEGHLKVYATIDRIMQKAAEDAVIDTLTDIEKRAATKQKPMKKGQAPPPMPESGDDRLQASLLAIDPASGEVRAMVGGRDTSSVGFNRALQSKRQPGSAFKPFVYAAAIENGYSPATVLDNLDAPIDTYKGAWLPEDEHSTASAMTIRTALRTSSNRAAVRMLEEVGIDRAVAQAKQLGIGTVPSVPSLALGSGEVTLASMTSAYAAFAQGGVVREPVFIRRVEDAEGHVLFTPEQKQERAISETTAFLMTTMLADVIDAGTAVQARKMGFTLPAAGKTGTTNDFVDAWFVGFTPKIVAGVWVGFDQPRPIMKNGFAAQLAVPLWTRFMKTATQHDAKASFRPPPGVVAVQVCRISGLLPVDGCKHAASINAAGEVSSKNMVYTEYFARGSEPSQTCTVHSVTASPYPEPYFAVGNVDNLHDLLGSAAVGTSSISMPVSTAPESSLSHVGTSAPSEPAPRDRDSAPASSQQVAPLLGSPQPAEEPPTSPPQ